MPVAVDADRDERDRVDHPLSLARLHRQRVHGHERERPRAGQRPVAEVLDDLVQVSRQPGDLRLAQRADAQRFRQLVHAPRVDASEVAVGGDGDQRRFCAAAALGEPFGGSRSRWAVWGGGVESRRAGGTPCTKCSAGPGRGSDTTASPSRLHLPGPGQQPRYTTNQGLNWQRW